MTAYPIGAAIPVDSFPITPADDTIFSPIAVAIRCEGEGTLIFVTAAQETGVAGVLPPTQTYNVAAGETVRPRRASQTSASPQTAQPASPQTAQPASPRMRHDH